MDSSEADPYLDQSSGMTRIAPKFRHQPCLLNLFIRQHGILAVLLDHYLSVAQPPQASLEIAPPVHRQPRAQLHQLAGEAFEVRRPEQRTIQPRGRHLQGVMPRDRVVHVEYAADLVAHLLAIIRRNAIGTVDVDPQQGSALAATLVLDPGQLLTHGADPRFQQFTDL